MKKGNSIVMDKQPLWLVENEGVRRKENTETGEAQEGGIYNAQKEKEKEVEEKKKRKERMPQRQQ